MAQRFEGSNLEEALEAAGTALGLERYQLTWRVMVEKRGFLGGVKRVVIEAEKNETAGPPIHEKSSFGFDLSGKDPAPVPQRRSGRQRSTSDGRRERAGGRPPRNDRRGETRRPRGQRVTLADEGPIEVPEQSEQSALAKEVSAWFAETFRLAGLDLVVRTTEDAEALRVQMYGSDSGLLIDRNGDLIDALQVIANKSFGRRDDAKNIECDARNYKGQRETELQERARRAADQVRRDGRELTLPAMSPIERRIVHLTLAEDAE